MEYLVLSAEGELQRRILGFAPEHALFLEVPGGYWKASRLLPGVTHALVSEVVVPGFDPADHRFLSYDELCRAYPQHVDTLRAFARSADLPPMGE